MEFRHFQTYRLPRGRRSDPPFAQEAVPLPIRSRARFYAPRRGRTTDVAATVAGGKASGLGRASRRRTVVLLPRRGRTFSFPPAQVVVAPPVWVPELRRRTRLVLFVRRGRFVDFPWPQVAPQPPPVWVSEPRRRGRYLPLLRRGHLFEIPRVQAPAPARARRARGLVIYRVPRGRSASPPWQQISVTPPARAPDRIGRRARFALMRKRGKQWGPNLVGALFGPLPDWLEGAAGSAGADAGASASGSEGGSVSTGSEAVTFSLDLEGTPGSGGQ